MISWLLPRVIGRRVWRSFGRYLLLIGVVTLNTALVLAVLYAGNSAVQAFAASTDALGGLASLELVAKNGQVSATKHGKLLEAIAATAQVVAVRRIPVSIAHGNQISTSELTGIDLFALQSAGKANALKLPTYYHGEEAVGVIVSADFARTLNTKLSDTVLLTTPRGLHRFTVVGVADAPGSPSLVTDIGRVWEIMGEVGMVDTFAVLPRNGGSSHLTQELTAMAGNELAVVDHQVRQEQARNLLGAFRLNIFVMALVALGVGAFAVSNGMTLGVVALTHDLMVLRTLGFPKKAVVVMILAESLVIGGIGTFLGLTLGFPLAQLTSSLILTTITSLYLQSSSFSALGFSSSWSVLAGAGVLGVVSAVVGALTPAWAAQHAPLLLAVRSQARAVKPVNLLVRSFTGIAALCCLALCCLYAKANENLLAAYMAALLVFFGLLLFTPVLVTWIVMALRSVLSRTQYRFMPGWLQIPLQLAVGQIGESVRGVGRSVAVAALGVALLVGVGVMTTGFRYTLAAWVEATFRADLYVSSTAPSTISALSTLPPQVTAVLTESSQVASIYESTTITTSIGNRMMAVAGVPLSEAMHQQSYQLTAGRFPVKEQTEVLVSESAARHLELVINNKLPIFDRDYLIVGVYKDFTRDRGTILMERGEFVARTGLVSPETVGVFLKDKSDAETVTQALLGKFSSQVVRVIDNHTLKSIVFSLFDETFAITRLLGFFVALMVGFGFLTSVVQQVYERRERLALLAVIGVRPFELTISVLCETFVVLVPALTLGGLAGLGLGWILVELINPLAFGWSLDFVVTTSDLLTPIFSMLIGAFLGCLVALGWGRVRPGQGGAMPAAVASLIFAVVFPSTGNCEGPASPMRSYTLSFPLDHGSHLKFRTEWWYYTGHLVTKGSDPLVAPTQFGVQLTFFRRLESSRLSGEAAQVYLAHAAIFDTSRGKFIHAARAVRGGLTLAGADPSGLHVWQQGWSAVAHGRQQRLQFDVADDVTYKVELEVSATRDPILNGEKGYSKKGTCAECASHYYSLAPLGVSGTVTVDGQQVEVGGTMWMDHEFMSNGLQKNQVGWDWCWLMRSNGDLLMASRVRGKTSKDDYAFGTAVRRLPNGKIQQEQLVGDDVVFTPREWWTSPATKTRYPVEMEVSVPRLGIVAHMKPLGVAQELVSNQAGVPSYWEGGVTVPDGKGFLELTGYGEAVGGL